MSSYSVEAERVDLSMTSGDDETFSITYKDEQGNVRDISGWTFWLTVKSDRSDTDGNAVVQKTVTSHVDAANGETEITLTASDTDGLSGAYWYDMQRKDSSGNVKTFMLGRLIIEEDVTEST